jgi:hypothetical protein
MGINLTGNEVFVFKNFFVKRDGNFDPFYLKFIQRPLHPPDRHGPVFTPHHQLSDE